MFVKGLARKMRFQMVPKSQGSDPEKWRDTKWVTVPVGDIETLITDRYGVSLTEYLFKQLDSGHVIETSWGYLRKEPAKGDIE